MSTKSRKTSRDALYTLLSSALSGVATVVNTDYSGFLGESPLVVVRSTGSSRAQRALDSTLARSLFMFDVEIYVPDASARTGETWGDTDAQDKLDALEVALGDVVLANRRGANWLNLVWAGESVIEPVAENGKPYKREIVPLVMTVDD